MHNFGLAYIATAREQLYTRVIHCNKPNNTAAFLTYPHKLSTVLCTFLHTCAQVTIVDNSSLRASHYCGYLHTAHTHSPNDDIHIANIHIVAFRTYIDAGHCMFRNTRHQSFFFTAISSHIKPYQCREPKLIHP